MGFSRRNWPEDTVLTMDVTPLQLDIAAWIVGWHLEVNHQLPDDILPPWRVSIEDTHDGALQKILGIVDIPENILCGVVAKSSVCDGVDDCAHLVPWVLLHWHQLQTMMLHKEEKRRGEGGRFDRRREGEITSHVTTLPGRATFHAHTK